MDIKMTYYILILCIIIYGRSVLSYFVIKGPETDRDGANQTCENYGLDLAVLETEDVMLKAFDFIRRQPNRDRPKFWIGLNWYESTGSFTWNNQKLLDYAIQWHNCSDKGSCKTGESCPRKCLLIHNTTTIGIEEHDCQHNHWSLCSNYFSTPNPTESPPGELFVAECPPNSYTLCNCHVIRNITRNGFDLDVESELRIDKKQTSAYIRKLRCAQDDRLSSRVIGCTAVTILVAVFLFILCLDIKTGKPKCRK